MSVRSSILFSSFTSLDDPLPRAWERFREQVRAGVATSPAAEGRAPSPASASRAQIPAGRPSGHFGIWRLLASNHRELARSSYVYGSFAAARGHVSMLRDRIDELEIVTVTGPTAGTHGWFSTLGGSPVITCGRWYGAVSASLEAAAGSLEAFRVAVVDEGSHRVLSPDRRQIARYSSPPNSW